MNRRIPTIHLIAAGMLAISTRSARADDVISFQTNVRPIIQTRCASCHNPDKLKGGLNMTTYQGLLAGGSGGKVVVPGKPDDSVILGVIIQSREPKMPPSGNKLPDAEIETVRAWIQQGCKETPDGPAAVADEGPVLQPLTPGHRGELSTQLPLAWPLAELTEADRPDAVVSIAAHPGSPVVALAAQQQVLIYHVPSQKLLGALPTGPGFPKQVRFSNDGRLLVAVGGVAAQSGFVRAWNTSDGNLVVNIEHASDAVLAADIDADLRWCALGSRSGAVQVHDLADGRIIHEYKKHTDWITDIQFSPDALLLATADRSGGVFVWESESHNLMHALPTHPGAVTSLAWRSDSNLLATACEDGQIRLYESESGAEVRSWGAHANGTRCVRWSGTGQLVTAGRDNLVKVWNPDFTPAKPLPAFDDIALACTFDCSGRRVIASDYNGNVRIMDVESGATIKQLDANPAPIEHQLAVLQQQHTDATQRVESSRAALDEAKAAMEAQAKSLDESSQALAAANLELKRLQAAELRAQLDTLRAQLAMTNRNHRPIYDAAKSADATVAEANAAVASARVNLEAADKSIETNEQQLADARQHLVELNETQQKIQQRLNDSQEALSRLTDAEQAVQQQVAAQPESDGLRQTLEHTTSAKTLLTGEIKTLHAQKDALVRDVGDTSTAIESIASVSKAQGDQRSIAVQRLNEAEAALRQATETAESHRRRANEASQQEAEIEAQIQAARNSYETLLAEVASAFN
ncbi:MAG: hypothetical protein H6819_11220 [Phycisphaerales bacterium]|nr:hypothetical protein [Phycisphaerales bacterium]MCB9854547.1 hypothetical protein [Phycisphaerales bacterium]MCB9863202.1 hypothetical protein [Phycisphaerales bacterium]